MLKGLKSKFIAYIRKKVGPKLSRLPDPFKLASNPNSLFNLIEDSGSRVTGGYARSCIYALASVSHGNILEIGTYLGQTTSLLCSAASFRNNKVFSVDTFIRDVGWDENSVEKHKFKYKSQYQIALSFLCSNCSSDSFDLYQGTSDQFFIDYANQSLTFGLIFIDGSHDYYQVLKDIRNSLEVLQPGGYLILDDYLSPNPSCGVAKAISEVLQTESSIFPVTIFDRILVLQKKVTNL